MAALTERKQVEEKDGVKLDLAMAVDEIFAGALLKKNAAGFLAPAAVEAGAVFAGVAYEDCDNSSGSAGDIACKVIRKGLFLLEGTGFAQTDVGVPVYASDDQTITKTYAADLQRVGVIDEFISATQVWVSIDVAASASIGESAIADLGAFTDPPSAGEMATLRTATNNILAALRRNEIIQG